MKTYEELMQDLTDTRAKLEEERKQMHAQLQKEKGEMLHLAQAERLLQLEAYQKKVEEHERKRKTEEDAAEERRVHEVAARAKAEQAAAKADDAFQLYQSKLQSLQHAITEAEFSEEKNRKDLETAKNMKILPDFVSENGISVDNPVSPSNKGEAVEGTGGLQESPLMSLHLKHILRQATRQD